MMTKENIIRMAEDAGFIWETDHPAIVALAELAYAAGAAAERELCAQVCEQRTAYAMPIPCPDGIEGCCVAHFVPGSRAKTSQECAEEIRARGEK